MYYRPCLWTSIINHWSKTYTPTPPGWRPAHHLWKQQLVGSVLESHSLQSFAAGVLDQKTSTSTNQHNLPRVTYKNRATCACHDTGTLSKIVMITRLKIGPDQNHRRWSTCRLIRQRLGRPCTVVLSPLLMPRTFFPTFPRGTWTWNTYKTYPSRFLRAKAYASKVDMRTKW